MDGLVDIHCHLLAGVDDGPRDLSESMKMVDLMYREGIREVIATSHYNHTIDFKPSMAYDESMALLREEVAKLYSDFTIYPGAEFRVRENYLDLIDADDSRILLNKGKYILIELQDDVSQKKVLDILYEINLRGYIPIIAHVERYELIYKDESFLRQVREQGACIQMSSKLVTERFKPARKLKKFLKKGYIDFIASDGHSYDRRRPLLRGAFEEVSRLSSQDLARTIFIKNPRWLLEGRDIRWQRSE